MTDRPRRVRPPDDDRDGGAPTAHGTPQQAYAAIAASDGFRELRRRYLSFAVPAVVVFMAWYIVYVLCNNWARDFMATPVVGHINVAVVFGLLQFVSTFVIAALYARHARRALDPLADELRTEFEQGSARRAETGE